MQMEFKKLELKPKGSFLQRTWRSPHTRKTLIAVVAGATLSFVFFYFSEGQHMSGISASEVFRSAGVGAFFGLFITNSPCARGRC